MPHITPPSQPGQPSLPGQLTQPAYRLLPGIHGQPAADAAYSLAAGTAAPAGAASSSASSLSSDFKELMTVMMLSMSMPSMGSSDPSGLLGGAAGGGMNGMAMMAPLMLTLMEKLLSLDLGGEPASGDGSATAEVGEAPLPDQVQAPNVADGEWGADVPHGDPLNGAGHRTQNSHGGHIAIDIGVATGTSVHSTMTGRVVYAGWNNEGYGNLVIVENGPYRTYYAHLSEIPVEVGQEVVGGQVVGLSGNTGNSTGPHLHYEVRKNGVHQDPDEYL